MRRTEARAREMLIETIGRGLEAVTAMDALSFLGHCGYRTSAQLL